MSAGRIFSDLKARFDQAAQHKLFKYWEERDIDSIAHRDFLSISWRGSGKYVIALEYRDAAAKEEAKRRADEKKRRRPPKKPNLCKRFWRWLGGALFGSDQVDKKEYSERFGNASKELFAYECLVFFKSSSEPEDGYFDIPAPVGGNPAAIPLHHYFLVTRYRTMTPTGTVGPYTPWTLEDRTFREASDLVEALIKDIFPLSLVDTDNAPEEEKTDEVRQESESNVLCVIGILVLTVIVATSIQAARNTTIRERLIGIARDATILVDHLLQGEHEPDHNEIRQGDGLSDRSSTARGREGHADSDADQATGAEIICDPDPEELTPSEELQTCQGNLSTLSDQMSELQNSHGLDLPPCWRPEPETPSTPIYLFDVFAVREGLRVAITDAALAHPDVGEWPLEQMVLGETLTIDQFARGAAPIYARSESNSCRHFVTLREGEHDSAAQYQAQRDMVERYFYIYRP